MVTVCAEEYDPPAGEKTGVAAAERLMTYPADTTALGDLPGATASACRNSVLKTVVGWLHCGEEVVGVVPSVVQ